MVYHRYHNLEHRELPHQPKIDTRDSKKHKHNITNILGFKDKKSINSYNTSNILFNFIVSRINKKLIPKNYQKKINLSNVLPNTLLLDKITSEDHKILNFLIIDVTTIFLLINHKKLIDIINSKLRSKSFFKFSNLSYNIKVQVVNSSHVS